MRSFLSSWSRYIRKKRDIGAQVLFLSAVLMSAKVVGQPTLSGSTGCAGSVLTVASDALPMQIVWQQGGVNTTTVTTTWATNAITVAGGNGNGAQPDQFSYPYGIFLDGNKNTYVVDRANSRVQKWAPGATQGVTVAGGNGDGNAANQFYSPQFVFVDGSGNIYVTDFINERVQKWAPGAIAGITVAGGNGRGNAANQLDGPDGLYVDDSGNIYIADFGNSRIQKWAPGDTAGITVAGGNGYGNGADQLSYPSAISFDDSGNMYIADYNNSRVQKWAPGATTGVTVAGGNGLGNAPNQVATPSAVYVDGKGNVYVLDDYNNRAQKWLPGAATGITIAGGNGRGNAGNQLDNPSGIYVDDSANVYVSDFANHRVQKFAASITNTFTAVAPGSYTAIVTSVAGTAVTNSVTVNAFPEITAISSNAPVCEGKALSLLDTITGGVSTYSVAWSGPNGFTAAVENPLVTTSATTAASGTYQLIVTDTNGCADTATTVVAVYPIQPIAGEATVIFGQTITLSDAATGGTWSSATPWTTGVRAATGIVKGVSAGASVITYTTGNGCMATHTVTVLSGLNVCAGQSITLSDGLAAGGSWSTNAASIATVSSAGVVTGIAAGRAVITHRLSALAVTTTTVTVHPLASTTAVPASVCQGQTIALANNTIGGGTWYSGNTATASINSSGTLYGLSGGNVAVYFTPMAGCVATKTVTITPVSPITGTPAVCTGQTTNLANAAGGGVWSSSNNSMATVYNGIVGGVSASTPTISYKMPNGCYATLPVTVKALSQTTMLSTIMCQNTTMTMTNSTAGGGTWSTDQLPTPVVSVNGSGVVSGLAQGTGRVYFNANNGCVATKTVTINAAPVLSGTPSVCMGQTTLLNSNMTGGIWSSSNNAMATVYNGIVGGVAASTPTISYKLPSGCFGTVAVTVNALHQISGGNTSICPSGTTTYTNSTPGGGIWSSSMPSVANVNGGGMVTGAGAAAGSKAVITFTSTANACVATRTVTIVACRDAAPTETEQITAAAFDVQLYPNPNNGQFVLKGNITAANGEDATYEIYNMLGQVVYRSNVKMHNRFIEEAVYLSSELASGTYMLRLLAGTERKVFHFVIGH